MKVAIIGGGAAGFFSAIQVKENYPQAQVILFEKSKKVLSKVKISGGGRCNVTNGCQHIKTLASAYPRGEKVLKKAFRIFSTKDTMEWFESNGVPLHIESDGRVFPKSNQSQSIIDCFFRKINQLRIEVRLGWGVQKIEPKEDYITLHFNKDHSNLRFDKVIIATGGSPKKEGLQWLIDLGHRIENPVPSLFTFNMPKEAITHLMGVVAPHAHVHIQGSKLKADGPVLITHWGMSGPAILKLSAFGARYLHNLNYQFNVQVNWVNILNQTIVKEALEGIVAAHPQKILSNIKAFDLPERLWVYLLDRSALPLRKKWNELGKKGINKLITTLTNDVYAVHGKTTFKEEFVTCGGVSLLDIDTQTMQSKVCKNVYFTGEVLDIDGITGGYNFQSAWTTAYIAGKLADH